MKGSKSKKNRAHMYGCRCIYLMHKCQENRQCLHKIVHVYQMQYFDLMRRSTGRGWFRSSGAAVKISRPTLLRASGLGYLQLLCSSETPSDGCCSSKGAKGSVGTLRLSKKYLLTSCSSSRSESHKSNKFAFVDLSSIFFLNCCQLIFECSPIPTEHFTTLSTTIRRPTFPN